MIEVREQLGYGCFVEVMIQDHAASNPHLGVVVP
jgi:hypothetical protein